MQGLLEATPWPLSSPIADMAREGGVNEHVIGAVVAFFAIVAEDATTLTTGMLIADGKLRFLTGWCWLTLGAVLGDVGLYAIGRFLGPRTLSWGFLPQDRMKRAKGWFGKNLVLAVLLSRCIPGTRTPTYIAAGFFGASAVRFLAIDAPAAMVWTFAWLTGLSQLGEAVLPLLGPYKWYILGAAVALIVLAHWLTSRLVQRRLTSAPGDGDSAKEAAGGEPPAKDRQRGA